MRKETDICDVCKNNIAVSKCDICLKDVCTLHGKCWDINVGSWTLSRISFCSGCLNKLSNMRGENLVFKESLKEFLKKQIIIEELK